MKLRGFGGLIKYANIISSKLQYPKYVPHLIEPYGEITVEQILINY